MKPDKDPAYLLDIIQAAQLILEFSQNTDREAFAQDVMRQDAIIRRIEIIGEATKRLSASFKDEHPEIPWKRMTGMRDIVIHNYDRVDLVEGWKVIHDDIPLLIKQIGPMIPPENET